MCYWSFCERKLYISRQKETNKPIALDNRAIITTILYLCKFKSL